MDFFPPICSSQPTLVDLTESALANKFATVVFVAKISESSFNYLFRLMIETCATPTPVGILFMVIIRVIKEVLRVTHFLLLFL